MTWRLDFNYQQSHTGRWIVFDTKTGEIVSEWASTEGAYRDTINRNRAEEQVSL